FYYPNGFFIGTATYSFYSLYISYCTVFFDNKLYIHFTFYTHSLGLGRIFQVFTDPLKECRITATLERRLVFHNSEDFISFFFFRSFLENNVFNYCFFCNLNIKVYFYLLFNFLLIRYLNNFRLLDYRWGWRWLLCWRNLHHVLEVVIYLT